MKGKFLIFHDKKCKAENSYDLTNPILSCFINSNLGLYHLKNRDVILYSSEDLGCDTYIVDKNSAAREMMLELRML